MKPLTILGGMGPQASSLMYDQIIQKSSKHPAHQEGVFPHVILRSVAIEDFISNSAKQKAARAVLVDAAMRAAADKSGAVAIACNTAHLFEDDVAVNCNAPFVSMIDLVADTVASKGIKHAGLLASPTTIRTHLYENALKKRGVDCLVPTHAQEKQVENAIRSVIDGSADSSHATILRRVAGSLVRNGAEGIVLGCTEIPLIFPKEFSEVDVFDSLDILSNELIDIYYR